MSKKYGYCRCSIDEEKQDITRQVEELKDKGVNEEDIELEFISGTKDKPKLLKLIERCNPPEEINVVFYCFQVLSI